MEEITILGPSGAGKTCYLYAMAERMALGVNDLTFTATNCIDALRLEEEWHKICDVGVMPPPTSCLHELHFTSSYSLAPFMEFNWYEWTGALMQRDCEESHILIERIKESSGVIVCIPAPMLKPTLTNDFMCRAYWHRLAALLRRISLQGNTPPLMFAITKADLLCEHEYEDVVRYLREVLFAPLFAQNSGWFVGIVPVSIGRAITIDGCNIVGGTINPWNVEIPVLFCIKAFLDEQLPMWEEQIAKCREDRSAASARLLSEQNKSAWSKFWNGDYRDAIKSDIQSIDQMITEASNTSKRMQAIVDNINQTINASNAIVFRNGQKISVTKGMKK